MFKIRMCSKMGSQIDTFSKMQEFCWSVGRGGGGKNASSIGFRPGSGPAWTAKLREMRAKYFCSMETKPPRRTTVVHVSTSKPSPLTPINRYPMNIA